MNRIVFLILLANLSLVSAQESKDLLTDIIAAESKRASSMMTFEANTNTGNYDLKYHRLELEVNPSVAFISGDVTSYFEAKESINQLI